MSVRSKSTINDRITSINQRQSLQDQIVMSVRSESTINDRITSINQRQSLQDQKLCLSEANQLLMTVLLLSTKDNHCRIKSFRFCFLMLILFSLLTANQLLMIVLLLSTKDNHCRIKSYVGQKQINH